MTGKDRRIKMSAKQDLEDLGKRILDASRTELLLSMRFMGSALDSLSYVCDLTTRTVGTDAVSIRFNPTFLTELMLNRPVMLNRVYIHMLLHCIFRHVFTASEYEDPDLFDLCADITVESVLDSMNYKAVQTTWSDFRQSWYERLEKDLNVITAERLYRYFTASPPDYDTFLKLHREFSADDHSFWKRLQDKETKNGRGNESDSEENPPGQQDASEQALKESWRKKADRVKVEMEAAVKDAQEYGSFLRTLSFVQKRRKSFAHFLKRFAVLQEETRIDPDSFDYAYYQYGLELYGNIPLIEENEYRESRKIRTLVIAIDTSGSCQDSLVQRFLNETADILLRQESFFRHAEILLIECDNRIQSETFFRDPAEMKNHASGFHIRGGFGTDFRPVFRRVEELLKNGTLSHLKGMMYFTDGAGVYPDHPYPWETAFVLYRDDNAASGRVPGWAYTLYLDADD